MTSLIFNMVLFCMSLVTVTLTTKDNRMNWYSFGWVLLLGTSFAEMAMIIFDLLI